MAKRGADVVARNIIFDHKTLPVVFKQVIKTFCNTVVFDTHILHV